MYKETIEFSVKNDKYPLEKVKVTGNWRMYDVPVEKWVAKPLLGIENFTSDEAYIKYTREYNKLANCTWGYHGEGNYKKSMETIVEMEILIRSKPFRRPICVWVSDKDMIIKRKWVPEYVEMKC